MTSSVGPWKLYGKLDRVDAQDSPEGPIPFVIDYKTESRARLRERFLAGGAQAVPDYEMLELVLFRAIPRQDVKPLARRLLDKFGDFNRVLSAPPARLREMHGVGDAVIVELKIIEAAAQRLARSKIINRHVLSSWEVLIVVEN